MGRSFNGSNQYLSQAATPITGVPLSLSTWFYAASATTTYDAIFVRDLTSNGADDYFGIYLSPSGNNGKIGAVAVLGGTAEAIAVTSTTFTANTWNQCTAVFTSATSRAAYLNGGGKGTNTTSKTPNAGQIAIIEIGGFFVSPTLFGAMSGRLAEVAVWDAALTDDEALSLSKGVSPIRVRPQNLRCYWPLFGNGSPEPNYSRNSTDYSLTLNNTPTQVDHAPVQMPFGRVSGWRYNNIRPSSPIWHRPLRVWNRNI